MRRSRAILLVFCGAAALEALSWWLPLPPIGPVSPYIPLRVALAATGGALLARHVGLLRTVSLVGFASVVPSVLGWTVAVLNGKATAAGTGPAVVLSVLTWVLGLGLVGALAGFAVGRRRAQVSRAV